MPNRENKSLIQEIRDIRVLKFPLGKKIIKHSRLSPDPQTQNSLGIIGQILENQGFLLLDAHQSEFDMMAVAVQMGLSFPNLERMIGPIAIKQTRTFLGSRFYEQIKKANHLDLTPVARKEDVELLSEIELLHRATTNEGYLKYMGSQLSKPNTLGVVAPYGSRKRFLQEEYLRWGAIELAAQFPFVCTLAAFDKRHLTYVVYLSQILTFNTQTPRTEIGHEIHNTFSQLYKTSRQGKP